MAKAIIQQILPGGVQVAGPYSPAMSAGDTIYISGQIARDASGNMVDDSIENATAVALENLRAVLTAAGLTPANMVKSTVFMRDLEDFAGMNKAYAAFFGDHRPARSTIQVAKLPLNSRVEIEGIAVRTKK